MQNKSCPICDKNMIYYDRYPKMVCHECSENTLTHDGENIKFYNKDHTGGFISIVNDVKGEMHDCYINNRKCYADEARFGGIVVQLSE
jgi:uncharacterized Zn ribbon protein